MKKEALRYVALGSFDSHTLMLQFHDPSGGPPENALARVATSTLAHELVHLAHTLGTAAGVREFLMTVEDHQLRLVILSRYLRTRGTSPEFTLPVLSDLDNDRIERANIGSELTLWARLQRVSRLYAGVERLPEPDAESVALFWLDPRVVLHGTAVPWEVAHANLLPFTGESVAVLPGYRQLTEGPAKIVERAQRRLAGEPGESSPAGLTVVPLEFFVRGTSSPYDPYYVALMAFKTANAQFAPDSPVDGYEEYVIVLADMAMMIDPVTTPEATRLFYGIDLDQVGAMKDGYSPFTTYLRLCRLFWENSTTLPHWGDSGSSMTDDVLLIQDALLWLVQPSLSMKVITRELQSSLERYRQTFAAHVLDDTPGIAEVFLDSFDRVLRFRDEVLDGGAFCEDFLTSREKLEDFAQFLSPTYAVGTHIVSQYEPRPGFGVGVDLTNLEMFRDFLDAMFYGNKRCPLAGDEHTPRVCALDPVPLCEGYPKHMRDDDDATYCVRDQTAQLGRAFGLTTLDWRETA